jgi:hypothetical protein
VSSRGSFVVVVKATVIGDGGANFKWWVIEYDDPLLGLFEAQCSDLHLCT